MNTDPNTAEDLCTWVEQDPDYGYWQACGDHAFSLEGGPPDEHGMKFCCYCGKNLRQVPLQVSAEDRTSDRIDFLQRWMRTPNPMLGNVSPLEMMRAGRGHKLAEFIETQFELNGGYCSERK